MPVSTIARPKGHPGYTQTLPCAIKSAGPARGLVRTALAVWGLEDLADDGLLVVTELVSNAARHTSCRLIRVSVNRPSESKVVIAVVDSSEVPVVPRQAQPDDTRGRGLMLVDALSARWGVTVLPFGKRVWCELEASA